MPEPTRFAVIQVGGVRYQRKPYIVAICATEAQAILIASTITNAKVIPFWGEATAVSPGAMTAYQNNRVAQLDIGVPVIPVGWTPANEPGLELAIRASVGVSATGANVTSVADQSGKAHTHAAVGSPQIVASAVNGLPGFTFSAGGQGLKCAGDTLFQANEARTILVVCQPATGGNVPLGGALVSGTGGPVVAFQAAAAPTWPARTFGLDFFVAGGTPRLNFYDDGGFETSNIHNPNVTPPAIAGKPIVYMVRYPGLARPTPAGGAAVAQDNCDAHGLGSVWINGVPSTAGNQGGAGLANVRQEQAIVGHSISCRVDAMVGAFFGGAISEVWEWHGYMSDAAAARVSQYFCNMYAASPLPDLVNKACFDDIMSGQITVTITATDATARKYIITASDLRKTAFDCGQQRAQFGYLNFSAAGPRFDLSAFAGKTLSSVALKCDQPFNGGGVVSASSDIRFYILNPTANTIATDTDAGFMLSAGNTQTPTWSTAGFALAADSQLSFNWSLIGP